MNKPYVICHMLTSLDGKISGKWFSHPACGPALTAYGELRQEFDCPAVLYGTVTMRESYSHGLIGKLAHSEVIYPRTDYLTDTACENYIVSLDPRGILGWNGGYIEKEGRPRAHVIQVLTDRVSNNYLAYLRKWGVSYVFAGSENIDCVLLLHKLKALFGIDRLLLAGGGVTNWSFASRGLVDELSIVMAPVADGSNRAVSIFEDAIGCSDIFTMELQSVTRLEGSTLWLRYKKEERPWNTNC